MSLTFFERKLDLNNSNVLEGKADADAHIGWGLAVKSKSAKAEAVLKRTGFDFRQETIKYQSKDGSGVVAGPSGGGEAGYKCTEKGGNLTAKAELSLARAEKNFRVTENMGAYLSANLNANTGLEIGADGVEVNLFGLDVTVGIGGKWTFNTPFGSIGGASMSLRHTNSSRVSNRHSNRQRMAI